MSEPASFLLLVFPQIHRDKVLRGEVRLSLALSHRFICRLEPAKTNKISIDCDVRLLTGWVERDGPLRRADSIAVAEFDQATRFASVDDAVALARARNARENLLLAHAVVRDYGNETPRFVIVWPVVDLVASIADLSRTPDTGT